MKKATVVQSFHDKKEDVLRKAGDVFLVDDERGLYLAKNNLVFLRETPAEKKSRKGK